jgi:hypothetical protein
MVSKEMLLSLAADSAHRRASTLHYLNNFTLLSHDLNSFIGQLSNSGQLKKHFQVLPLIVALPDWAYTCCLSKSPRFQIRQSANRSPLR